MAHTQILSRSVPCNWTGCRNTTRDPSLFCNHHRRAALPGQVLVPYRDGATAVGRLRTPTVEILRSQNNSDTRLFDLGNEALDAYPEITEMNPNTTIIHKMYAGSMGDRAHPNDANELNGVRAVRRGPDLYLTQGEPRDRAAVAVALQKNAWQSVAADYHIGVTGGVSEHYDDLAEILAQLKLERAHGVPEGSLHYSPGSDSGSLVVRIVSTTPDDITIREERYILPLAMSRVEERVVLKHHLDIGKSEVLDDPFMSRHSQPVSMDLLHERAELLNDIGNAASLAWKYAVVKDDGLHLPAGWTQRDL